MIAEITVWHVVAITVPLLLLLVMVLGILFAYGRNPRWRRAHFGVFLDREPRDGDGDG